MKKLKYTLKISGYALGYIGATLFLRGFFLWWDNPSLTQMQVFQQTWITTVSGPVVMAGGWLLVMDCDEVAFEIRKGWLKGKRAWWEKLGQYRKIKKR